MTQTPSPTRDEKVWTAGRRQVTALSYDLVGSTRLSSQLDPEDMMELQRRFHQACTRAVQLYGGHVEKYTGDGAMAYFGLPSAHEDDPERAVRAGLAIVAECKALSADLTGGTGELAVRVGVATGVVASSGEGGMDQADVVGFAPNLAFKVQAAAAPNCVCVSDSTQALTAGHFEFERDRQLVLKDVREPQPIWRVLRVRRPLTRFDAARTEPLTPLVSRAREIALIERCWHQAMMGRGQLVLVSGEPGIGKSRLALSTTRKVADEAKYRLVFQCSPQRTETALHPVVNYLERVLALDANRGAAIARLRLARLLRRAGTEAEAALPLFERLVGLEANGKLNGLSAEVVKERTLAALIDLAQGLSRQHPTLIVVEDGHWLDATSRELLDELFDRLASLRVLVIVTARPQFAPSWLGKPHASFVPLRRLGRQESAAIVRHILGKRSASTELVERIAAIGEGVPLFVEELSRSVMQSGALQTPPGGTAEKLRIPASLYDSFMARLDQLGAVKRIMQVGSVIGRTFPLALAREIAGAGSGEDGETVGRILELGLASVHRRANQTMCTFKHVLFQEAAYQSLLRTARQTLHRQVAETLEAKFAGTRDAAPEILAYHYAQAGVVDRAVEKYHEAGRLAASASANVEAAQLLQRALELAGRLPEGEQRDTTELDIVLTLGPILIMTSGPGTAEVQAIYDRAIALCSRLPRSARQFPAFWGWWRVSPNFMVMRTRAETLFAFAGSLSDDGLRLQAHHCQWATLFNLGEHEACCAHIAEGLALYDSGDFRSHGSLYGNHDPKACALGEKALSLWLLGYPDTSLGASAACVSHAAGLRHAGTIAHARDQEIMLRRYRREAAIVTDLSTAMRTFATELAFSDLAAKVDVFQGWAMAVLGQPELGAGLIEKGLAAQRAIGTEEDFPVYYEMLAEAYGLAGQPERGLPYIDEAIAMANRTGLNYWTAELLRRKGELILSRDSGAAARALALFDEAASVAAAQKARSLQLRAALAKARVLMRRDGERDAAINALSLLLDSFDQGFDTVDLQEASIFLREARRR